MILTLPDRVGSMGTTGWKTMRQPFTSEKLAGVARLCVRHGVRHLNLFGSCATEAFDPQSSDLDFLVEFWELTPAEHADAFFGLMADLSEMFGRPVDLVEKRAIRNPYFRQSIEQSLVTVYDAA